MAKTKERIGITLRKGMKFKFTPKNMIDLDKYGERVGERGRTRKEVEAVVISINKEHRHFTLEYDCFGRKLRETRNFHDVGRDVFPV